MPDQSLYPETEDAVPAEPAAPAAEAEDTEAPAEETALLPKTILGGKTFNVGDEVVLKVTAIYDDEVEVAYATGDEEEAANVPMSETSPDMAEAEGKLESMVSY